MLDKSPHRLTRRRVMKAAMASGFSVLTASRLTVDDVKAADSDEVVIYYDTEGRDKTHVPKGWYDYIQRARDVNERMKKRFTDREGISDIGMRVGDTSEDNPYVFIGVDKNSSKKDERRGEVPEERDGIRIEVEERDPSARKAEAQCADEKYDQDDQIPGGLGLEEAVSGNDGSFTSRLFPDVNYYDAPPGWATAAHVLERCDNAYTIKHKPQSSPESGRIIGQAWFIDQSRDFVAIRQSSWVEPRSDFAKPSAPNNSLLDYHVDATLSQDGLETLMSRDTEFIHHGARTCRTRAQISSSGERKFTPGTQFCNAYLKDQVEFGSGADDETNTGDSGGGVISEPIDDQGDKQYFSHLHSGSGEFNAFGVGGWAIRKEHNMWWGDI